MLSLLLNWPTFCIVNVILIRCRCRLLVFVVIIGAQLKVGHAGGCKVQNFCHWREDFANSARLRMCTNEAKCSCIRNCCGLVLRKKMRNISFLRCTSLTTINVFYCKAQLYIFFVRTKELQYCRYLCYTVISIHKIISYSHHRFSILQLQVQYAQWFRRIWFFWRSHQKQLR